MDRKVFSLLCKPVRKLVKEKGFIHPADPQIKAIPHILDGKNVLLISPTGTGKTEAVILPIFSNFMEMSERSFGIKILYITPLRALNRDLLERLEWWCGRLDIKLSVRHGDTGKRERIYQSKSPPDMLITTPETLQAILPGRNMRRHLQSIEWLVIDEIHELAEDKRGSLLSLTLERLRIDAKKEFQVVGLSATIGHPEKVAQFLVGSDRSVEILKIPVARFMDFKILYPSPIPEDYALAVNLYTRPEVAARLRVIRELIEGHRSVLLFTNTRAVSEVLASRFKIWDLDFPVSIHHGSLSKPARVTAERGLKNGELKGLVCTSSLELGIDVGSIDLCIQYMSPRQVTRLIQRVGRSGHRIGRVAQGIIITMDSEDTLEAMVVARRAFLENLEPVSIPEKPLDALSIQIIGLLMRQRRWQFDEIIGLFSQAYPYRDLNEDDLVDVLQYLHTRFPRLAWVSFEDKMVMRPMETKNVYQYYYENLSMIPDVKSYLVVDETNDTPVGVLDEAFVAEYGDPGTKFIVRGSAWSIVSVTGDKIIVKPVEDPTGAIPSWVGEQIPVPYDVAFEVGEIRGFVEENLKSGLDIGSIVNLLVEKYPADKEVILKSLKETIEQVNMGVPVPTNKRITIEDHGDYIIIQSSFGTLVNRTLSTLLGKLISENSGYSVGVQQDPYRILIRTMGLSSSDELSEIIKRLSRMDVREAIADALSRIGLFKRRIIQVARKFGAISRWADYSTITLGQLKKSFEGTAVFDEAVKDTLDRDMDLENLKKVVSSIDEGEIEVLNIQYKDASPIARIGIEKFGERSSLIPSERIDRLVIETAKARLLNEVRTLVCTNCWNYVRMIKINDLPDKLSCPNCDSGEIGVLNETEDLISKICSKKAIISSEEKKLKEKAITTAKLVNIYGRMAVLVLAGKRLDPSDVVTILSEKDAYLRLYELIIDAERKALSRRFW